MNDNTRQGEALKQLIAAHSSGRSRRRWIWLAVIFLTLAGAAAAYFMRSGNDAARPRFKTEAAAIGQLVVRISATVSWMRCWWTSTTASRKARSSRA